MDAQREILQYLHFHPLCTKGLHQNPKTKPTAPVVVKVAEEFVLLILFNRDISFSVNILHSYLPSIKV